MRVFSQREFIKWAFYLFYLVLYIGVSQCRLYVSMTQQCLYIPYIAKLPPALYGCRDEKLPVNRAPQKVRIDVNVKKI